MCVMLHVFDFVISTNSNRYILTKVTSTVVEEIPCRNLERGGTSHNSKCTCAQ